MAFITAGDPEVDASVPAMHSLAAHGADIIELGVPFTDPEADGPSIQRSSERAIANGVTLRKTCEIVTEFRASNTTTPVVLMGYLNPILAIGVEAFAHLAHAAGIDGLIIVNLPPEEADSLAAALAKFEIDLIFLVAPTTPAARMANLANKSTGFIYYVSFKGITGADHLDVEDVQHHVLELKTTSNTPVAVGFGIKTAEHAKAVAKIADAVVVGSALVDILGNGESRFDQLKAIQAFTQSIKQAITSH